MRNALRIIAAVIILSFAGLIALIVWHISKPRVIARAVAPDGTEMCLVQRCNWGGEMFTTSFYSRKPGMGWGWFYYDHQDNYWGRSRVELDTNSGRAFFFRDEKKAVTFAWRSETYTLHRWNRVEEGPQRRGPPGLPPPWEK